MTTAQLARSHKPAQVFELYANEKLSAEHDGQRAEHEAHRWDGPAVFTQLCTILSVCALAGSLYGWGPRFLASSTLGVFLLYFAGIYIVRRAWAIRHHKANTRATAWSQMAYKRPVDLDQMPLVATIIALAAFTGAGMVPVVAVLATGMLTLLVTHAIWSAVGARANRPAAVIPSM